MLSSQARPALVAQLFTPDCRKLSRSVAAGVNPDADREWGLEAARSAHLICGQAYLSICHAHTSCHFLTCACD